MKPNKQSGFTVVEVLVAIVVLGIMITGVALGFQWLIGDYAKSREYNEIYAALSGCPEIDRAMQYESIVSTNCSPNDTFDSETASGNNDIAYNTSSIPQLTSSLNSADPVYNVPNAKVIDVVVTPKKGHVWKIRLLVSRNGIGQQ